MNGGTKNSIIPTNTRYCKAVVGILREFLYGVEFLIEEVDDPGVRVVDGAVDFESFVVHERVELAIAHDVADGGFHVEGTCHVGGPSRRRSRVQSAL